MDLPNYSLFIRPDTKIFVGSTGSRNTSNNPNPSSSSAAAVCDSDYSSSGAEVTKILGDTSHVTRTRAQSETNISPRLESDSSVAVSSSFTQDTFQSAIPSNKYSSDKIGAAQAEVAPEMKTNDLNLSLNFPGENDLSNLPFSMPKLERRLKEEKRQSLVISSLTNHLVSAPPPSKKPSLNLNIPARSTRPVSLHATCHVSTPNVSNPAISQLKLPLQGK